MKGLALGLWLLIALAGMAGCAPQEPALTPTTAATPTQQPTPTSKPTPQPTATPTLQPTPAPTPTLQPTTAATLTVQPMSATPMPQPTATATPTATSTPRPTPTPTPSPSPTPGFPRAQLQELGLAYWDAFNSYDLERVLSYLEPSYRAQREETLREEIGQVQTFRVKLGVTVALEPHRVREGEALMYIDLKTPIDTRRVLMRFQLIGEEWMITFAQSE